MAHPIKKNKTGVSVRINLPNAKKIIRITRKTHRTFASEVNVGVEEYADEKIAKYRDNGK